MYNCTLGYTSSYAKLVFPELALYDVPIENSGFIVFGCSRPCRLCPHVIVLCGSDPWGYAVEPLMPAGHGALRRAQTLEVRFCSSDVPVQANQ